MGTARIAGGRGSGWGLSFLLALLAAAILAGSAGVAQAQAPVGASARRPVGFLTGPRAGDALEIVREYLADQHAALGLEKADVVDWVLTDRTVTRHNGLTHLYLRQRLAGIEVRHGELAVSVSGDGRLIGLGSRFVPGLARAANARAPALGAAQAVQSAAGHLGLALTGPLTTLETRGGPAREVLLGDGGISLDPIPVKLMYLADGEGAARLIWDLDIRPPGGRHWWHLGVDALDGEVLLQVDRIVNDKYRVFALPKENPDAGPRSDELDPADATASPFGWHDTNGAAGAEHTDTRGNNVNAQDDTDGNNSGGVRPSGGAGLEFLFALYPAQPPSSSLSAAVTNLFYWNNVLHDIHYQYGFDEVSGNFQATNRGLGGAAGDPVLADAQDGSGFNNANFSLVPDGTSGRMQMFLFRFPGVKLNAPASIAQSIGGATAGFGPALTVGGITRDVVQAIDATGSATDGCESLTNPGAVAGKIALIDRGTCTFVEKVANAQAAGADAALIVNHLDDELVPMGGSDPSITIPSLLIGLTHGALVKAALGSGVNATLSSQVFRDGDLDHGIIAHEYGHGVGTRLTGGPSSHLCLAQKQSQGMGEGWGDFWGLALTATAADAPTDARPIGSYALGEGPHGPGIRDFPYTTDLGVNPQTLASIDCPSTQQPHCVGQVWAAALWEVYWSLVGAHGFDPDLYGGSGGNNLALQLVMDGLKLQECQPTFLGARDAILEADEVNNGGANQCLIWQAFARRGMGVDADDRGNPRFTRNMTDDFTVPSACVAACGNGTLEPGEQCDDGGTADGDCCSSTCQFESAATQCRASAGDCDLAESCPGDAGACPADAFELDTVLCRAATDLCDAAEFCPGDAAQCPTDAFLPDTAQCRGAVGACDLPELCTGLGAACPADAKSTALCRGIGGTCDVAESCDGVSDQCPPDLVDPGLCTDSNPCTTEACVVLDCQFTNLSDGTLCADGDVCNGGETCQAGACSAGASLDCDDGDACTADGCDAVSGCLHDPIPECVSGSCGDGTLQPELGEECDDGNQEGGDGCAADCLLEPALVPALESPALWTLAALLLALGLVARRGPTRPGRA